MSRGLLILVYILSNCFVYAQNVISTIPKGMAVPVLEITPPDLRDIHEDSATKVFEFGKEVHFSINLSEKMVWYQSSSGSLTGVLDLYSNSAYSLSLNFDLFKLIKGSELYFGSMDNPRYYSLKNQTADIPFSTLPSPGSRARLMLCLPAGVSEIPDLPLQSVVYGYKNIFNEEKGFGNSGFCNVNINCQQGTDWTNEKRSVAMILTASNTRMCTGALINNKKNDGKPYLLTARHCNTSPNSNFMFNYESPDCSSIDGITTQVIQGCSILSQWAVSDFTLVELSSNPPADFNVFYAGWNAEKTAPSTGTGIHHPKGDIKKISFDYNAAVAAPYLGSGTDSNHWQILTWDVGTTEPGSSGSPLFDSERKIVGQLHGGQANCANSVNDYYGMFNDSWNGGGTVATSLQPWLDPDSTGILKWPGFDPNTPITDYDLKITAVSDFGNLVCADSVQPVITVRNMGSEPYQRIQIKLNQTVVIDTILDFPYSAVRSFGLPYYFPVTGSNIIRIEVVPVQPNIDRNPDDNFREISFVKANQGLSYVTVQADGYGNETRWEISTRDGNVLYTSSDFGPFELRTTPVCLNKDCYIFKIYDTGGDGICCTYGDGRYEILDSYFRTVASGAQFFSEDVRNICLPDPQDNSPLPVLYPNPAKDILNILIPSELIDKEGTLTIFDMNGKIVLQEQQTLKYFNTFDVSKLAVGVYGVNVKAEGKKVTQKFIRN